ncbi:hypothetical protein D8M38_12415 [Kocuria sp. HSID17582]|nr:hypothetical protein D8M38_12415 [Kocuria sp. HSID17582]
MDSMRGLARFYADLIQEEQPEGPYDLLGYPFGGTAAHHVAAEPTARGERVSSLTVLDAHPAGRATPPRSAAARRTPGRLPAEHAAGRPPGGTGHVPPLGGGPPDPRGAAGRARDRARGTGRGLRHTLARGPGRPAREPAAVHRPAHHVRTVRLRRPGDARRRRPAAARLRREAGGGGVPPRAGRLGSGERVARVPPRGAHGAPAAVLARGAREPRGLGHDPAAAATGTHPHHRGPVAGSLRHRTTETHHRDAELLTHRRTTP